MKLILLRHGQTEANEKHLYCGATDIGLSEAGAQALLRQKSEINYPDITDMRVVTSGMKRCEETLRILYGNIPHETDAAFREMDFGVFEMRAYEELKSDPSYIAWITGDNEANIAPGGESGNVMSRRVLSGLDRIMAEKHDTLLVTHGGAIATIMSHFFPTEQKNRYEWQPVPGGGYLIDCTRMQYSLIFYL